MASEDRKPAVLRIVLFGDTGSGKSSTGNTILGKRAFTTRQSRQSETLTCQAERGEFKGTPVSVVDTPGSIWPNTSEMSKCISYCAPGPHAFLLVIPLKRFTDVDRQLKSVQRMFGENASRYTIVLFPGGDELPDGVTAEEFIRHNPLPYGVGYHVFNNRDEDPSQVRELLEKINTMVLRNGGSYCIKVKDWKHKYLYPIASAVTIGGGIGAASGGTAAGVLVAVVGSIGGAAAAADGGNRAVAKAVAAVGAMAVGTVAGVGIGTGLEIAARAGPKVIVGDFARILFAILILFMVLYMFCMLACVAFGAFFCFGCEYRVEPAFAIGCIVAGCLAAHIGVFVGFIRFATPDLAVVVGAEVAAKAAAAIFAAAGTAGAAFEVFDVDKFHNVCFCARCAIIGGAGVGAGGPVIVRVYILGADDKLSVAGLAVASVVVVLVLCILFLSVHETLSAFNKTVGCAIVGVFAGAAFGAAVATLGVSGVLAGVIIIIACKAVTLWLNRKS